MNKGKKEKRDIMVTKANSDKNISQIFENKFINQNKLFSFFKLMLETNLNLIITNQLVYYA